MSDELKSVYDDFFGNEPENHKSDERALKKAREALDEAYRRFGSADLPGYKGPEDTASGSPEKAGEDSAGSPAGNGAGNTLSAGGENAAENASEAKARTAADAEADKEEPESDPEEDLKELIGLKSIKHDVLELTDFRKIQKMRADSGMKTVPVSNHLVFTGNPGTGKTTVARILARLYKKIGVLSKGQLVETDRSGLVAGYVGQTALKTQKKIEEAMGGVLFIDEAYSLAQGSSQGTDFGQEAVDTLLKAMEDHRDEFIVIAAGYTKPMETFIHSNPGLKSRFNKFIEFPDYTIDELMQIFELNLKKYQYTAKEEVLGEVKQLIMLNKAQNLENFANARAVRNLFENIITNQARRISKIEHPTQEEMQEILSEDLHDDGEEIGE